MLAGDQLADTHQATTVRQADGKALSTDGPFAETNVPRITFVEGLRGNPKHRSLRLDGALSPPEGGGRPRRQST